MRRSGASGKRSQRQSPLRGVFWINYPRRSPQPAWTYLEKVAEKNGKSAIELREQHRPDLSQPLLLRT